MHFDDRLATVLQHRASGARAARVQFRQLIDLLGEPVAGTDAVLQRAAYRRLDALARLIRTADRARIVAEVGSRIRTPDLLSYLAQSDAEVALAALARAVLTETQWQGLIPELPIRARGLLRHRRALPPLALALLDRLGVRDRVLPEPTVDQIGEPSFDSGIAPPGQPAEGGLDLDQDTMIEEGAMMESGVSRKPANPSPPHLGIGSGDLGALVRRIEEFQRARESQPVRDSVEAPRLPLGEETIVASEVTLPGAFSFTTNIAGRIDWAECRYGSLMTGAPLAPRDTAHLGPVGPLAAAVKYRRPLRGTVVEWTGPAAIAGEWIVDIAPRIDPVAGQFTGFVGRCRRPAPAKPSHHAREAAEKVRQLLHELRNPVTAIQGFAEVIQQQALGPVPHAYRAHAASITQDSARLLAGFEEIERLARIEAGTLEIELGQCEFTHVVRRQISQLSTALSPRVARIETDWQLGDAQVPISAETAELLAWRILGTIAAVMGGGETVLMTLKREGKTLRLATALPTALARSDDVFSGEAKAAPGPLETSLLGTGFTLRLARAEARAAGGNLMRENVDGTDHLVLSLPLEEAKDRRGVHAVDEVERIRQGS